MSFFKTNFQRFAPKLFPSSPASPGWPRTSFSEPGGDQQPKRELLAGKRWWLAGTPPPDKVPFGSRKTPGWEGHLWSCSHLWTCCRVEGREGGTPVRRAGPSPGRTAERWWGGPRPAEAQQRHAAGPPAGAEVEKKTKQSTLRRHPTHNPPQCFANEAQKEISFVHRTQKWWRSADRSADGKVH